MGYRNKAIIFVTLVFLISCEYYYNVVSTRELSLELSARVMTESKFNIGQQEEVDDDTVFVHKRKIGTSLPELVKPSIANSSCPEYLYPIEQVHNREADEGKGRKIPQIVHVTGKTRCLTKAFYDNVNKWKFENHSFYFHDDEAVDRLLFERDWPMFPQLKNAMECIKDAGGAAKADLWRLLVLWEYGGIYTDMDNAPGELFHASTITPDIDAFFLQERGGFASQYFFAASPHHPITFLAIYELMIKVIGLEDIGDFYVPVITGPRVIKNAILVFMGYNRDAPEEVKDEIYHKYAKPSAGTYIGKFDPSRTVTIAGRRKTTTQWVRRGAVQGKTKNEGFKMMNITDYQRVNKKKRNVSCRLSLFKYYETARD